MEPEDIRRSIDAIHGRIDKYERIFSGRYEALGKQVHRIHALGWVVLVAVVGSSEVMSTVIKSILAAVKP